MVFKKKGNILSNPIATVLLTCLLTQTPTVSALSAKHKHPLFARRQNDNNKNNNNEPCPKHHRPADPPANGSCVPCPPVTHAQKGADHCKDCPTDESIETQHGITAWDQTGPGGKGCVPSECALNWKLTVSKINSDWSWCEPCGPGTTAAEGMDSSCEPCPVTVGTIWDPNAVGCVVEECEANYKLEGGACLPCGDSDCTNTEGGDSDSTNTEGGDSDSTASDGGDSDSTASDGGDSDSTATESPTDAPTESPIDVLTDELIEQCLKRCKCSSKKKKTCKKRCKKFRKLIQLGMSETCEASSNRNAIEKLPTTESSLHFAHVGVLFAFAAVVVVAVVGALKKWEARKDAGIAAPFVWNDDEQRK